MKAKTLINIVCLVVVSLGISDITKAAPFPQKPNIIVIYADDLGWTDTGVYGAKYYRTPNIDKLAREGMRFTNAYSNSPNCAPSRGALYSGQYCGRTGMYNVGYAERGKPENRSLIPPPNTGQLNLDIKTFADALTKQGYNCVNFGKWHLGYSKTALPPKRGFLARYANGPHKGKYMSEIIYKPSRWAHFHYGPSKSKGDGAFQFFFGDVSDDRNNPKNDFKVENEELIKKNEYLSEYMDRKAPAMIRDLKSQKKPFLIMVNKYLVHGPLNAPQKDIDSVSKWAPEGADKNPIFAAMVKKLDDSVGLMMGLIKKEGLLDNTILLFYSDNGGVGGYHKLGIDGAGEHTDNSPLKGGKTMLYEGGIRVPMIAWWPGKIKAGTLCHEPIAGIDLFPTFLELAGSSKKEFVASRKQVLDGLSIVPLLKDPKAKLKRDFLAFHFPAYALGFFGKGGKPRATWRSTPMSALRTREYKIVEHFIGEKIPGDGSRIELYDIKNDPGETEDISKKEPEMARKLHGMLKDWRRETGARVPARKDYSGKTYVKVGGLVVGTANDEIRTTFAMGERRGVVVVDRDKNAPKMLRTSLVITGVDDKEVTDAKGFYDLMKASTGKRVKLKTLLYSKDKTISFDVTGTPEYISLDKSLCNDHQDYVRKEPRSK